MTTPGDHDEEPDRDRGHALLLGVLALVALFSICYALAPYAGGR